MLVDLMEGRACVSLVFEAFKYCDEDSRPPSTIDYVSIMALETFK